MPKNLTNFPPGIELKDEDIYEAMKSIPGYLDITPGDSKMSIVWPTVTPWSA